MFMVHLIIFSEIILCYRPEAGAEIFVGISAILLEQMFIAAMHRIVQIRRISKSRNKYK